MQYLPICAWRLSLDWEGISKKPMFGGLGYFLYGNMCVGAWHDYLIARVGAKGAALKEDKHTSDMDITGKPMSDWIKVSPGGWQSAKTRADVLEAARASVLSLLKK